ncbi:3-hydroxyacyl-CoA dehydrogenase family protein [Alkalihalobacillus oceani]|uniref:3-hydroxyacyl-CoA dehydrogenase family protein n=1 Tax=Halalkalibacter oceani TaxID=1653776 RepID=UPI002041DCFC|nr:3-hydroxyacyl-CoA dehydrogenase family protein [Halalkalibacter oceani]MCM3759609.1 3-hydroxyacyl-CoA dehydrogenase family protein [Halalkalibacter oceani]
MEELSVLGAGTMGHSIAISAALAGMTPVVYGINELDLQRAQQNVREKLNVLTAEGLIQSDETEAVRNRLRYTDSLQEAIENATFIIEAIPENLTLKQNLFHKLDEKCAEGVILASNTSGLSPTEIALRTTKAERTVVTHFWNPAHLIPLVEVIRGQRTSDQTVERTFQLLHFMKKKPIEVKKDILGSIVNRLQYALFREAQHILALGAASKEDIDAAVVYSIGRRLPVTGPFLTADMGGLDVFDTISEYLFTDLSKADHSYDEIRALVKEGKYGQKTGEGFYVWTESFTKEMNQKREQMLIHFLKEDDKLQ